MKKKTTEDFIKEAKQVHGDKYDYSECIYRSNKEKVTIICKEHGTFLQTPHNHLYGNGCPKCGHDSTNKSNVLTNKEFIKKSIEIHGEYYDYSKVEYERNNIKVCIICPEHGEFWMTPANHVNGQGCPKCGHIKQGEGRRKGKDEIIERFIKIHGEKYDYSQMDYVDTTKKIYIICKEHGGFWQTPENHFNGCGCPLCAGNIRKTKEEFIEEAKKVHGNKYDYSKVDYQSANKRVTLICKKHGEFQIFPNAHLRGSGCPKCVGKHKTTEDFVNQCKEIHGDKYDYSKVEYKGAFNKVTLNCPIHGDFEITPHSLLAGQGCKKCSNERTASKQRKTFDDFKKDVDAIYGNGYVDMTKVVYVNAHTPVTISTPYTGEIEVIPNKLTSKKLYKLLRESYLAHEVRLFLQENNIDFKTEQKFEWLKDKTKLRLDFYLPEYNVAIECQGIQHFVPTKHFKTAMPIDEQIKRDELKYDQCKTNGIHIFYYTDEPHIKYDIVSKIYYNNLYCDLTLLKKEIDRIKI